MQPHKSTQKKLGLVAALCLGGALCVSAQSLAHRYSFSDTAGSATFVDSVGGADGTLNNDTAINPTSASLDGTQLELDGTGGFATLPGGLISGNTQVTVEFWASFGPTNNVWTRVFAFGDQNGTGGADTSFDYSHFVPGNYQNVNLSTAAGGLYANNNVGLNGVTNVHITVIADPPHNKLYYYNGTTLVSSQSSPNVPPLSGLNDSLSLIGRSLFDVDPVLNASINEFRIYSGVLPISTVALNDASGPDNVLSSPGTIQALHFSSPANPLVVNQLSQQALTGDFTSVSGLDLTLYGGATFTSLDTSVATISTNGAVKAVAPGTVKVVASYGGMSATNSLTVVSIPATLTHRYSFNSDASDSVGGANGTLMGTAAISGGQLVLDGSAGCYLDLPGGQINIATNPAVTFDAWVTFGDATTWAELFGFGNTNGGNGVNNIACVPCAEGGGFRNWGLTENLPNGRTPSWSHGWADFTAHITVVLDPPTGALSVYRDGVLEIAEYDATALISTIATNYAFIGRSFFSADPYLPASVNEFRIYSGALTPAQVALVQQGGVGSTSLDVGALSSIVVVATNYPAYAALVPPVILANYANLANFNLLPTVTAGGNVTLSGPQGLVVTSSDPTIISVNAQNMLTTHRPGTVTLTASYGGKSNSATVAVKNMAVLAHRYDFNTDGDASDSVGGANGTLQGAGSITGGQLQL
ncbi:MAG TPA: LamG-like jellyroll fold domain-containing protein, partial [Verrucomicrobiae bacterium]|nr:LamG-like jellyroll fold domain-containing protein [Verrucomicrobiae bacterium]